MPIASRIPHLYKVNYIVRDGFNRADSSSLGNAETGQAWTGVGTLQIVSGRLAGSTGGDIIHLDSGLANVEVSGQTLHFDDGINRADGQLVLRMSDTNNLWLVTGEVENDRFALYDRQAGTFTQRATYPITINSGSSFYVVYRAVGNTHTVYINGVRAITHTSSFNNTATRVGVRMRAVATPGQRQILDDFLVRPA